jgi:hypothetical protein
MPSEDQHLDGNEEETSTSDETRESDSASEDLDSLFEDDSPKDETPEEKVKRLEEKIARIEKGVKKLATERGREKKEQKERPTEEKVEKTESNVNPVLKSLYFKANPEAQEIWDEVEKDARLLGKDPFVLYESSAYYKGEAKARAEAKAEEEKNKAKVNKPSSEVGFKADFSKIKTVEDYKKLTPKEREEYNKWRLAREGAS